MSPFMIFYGNFRILEQRVKIATMDSSGAYFYDTSRRGYERAKAAAPVRTNQVNKVLRHPRTTFGAVVVNTRTLFCGTLDNGGT